MIDPAGIAQQILDNLATSVVLLDADHQVLALNPAAENLLQVSADGLRDQPLARCFDSPDALTLLLDRCQHYDQTYAVELELRARTDHHRAVTIDVRVAPWAGVPAGALLVEFSDISSRVRINRDNTLRSQHGVGRRITRQLAHEIKNPLGGLRGAAQLLQRQISDAELREYTNVIIGEADRLASLVDALLGPGGAPSKSDVNIHDVLEHVLRIVSADIGPRLLWRRDYDPSLPVMHLDRDQMIQAVLNIVRNAAAATKEQNEAVISLRTRALTNETIGEERHRVIASIEIEDNGPGIDPALQDSVFYPLVTGRPDGTGIGLPLSQELINRHDGLIEYTSEPGRTTFQIRLPLDED
ncbi:MAG: nitrogen regulation protein NR(II) [Pseudomonadota bacterium]